jgi:hypothetical protein
MEHPLIRGKTTQEKWQSLEVLLKSFQRRLSTKVITLTPPIPILHAQMRPDEGGKIFAAISPMQGTISALCIYFGIMRKELLLLNISITRGGSGYMREIECKKRTEIITLSVPIEIGDVVRISAAELDVVEDILIGILLIPDMAVASSEAHLLEAFLQLEKDEERGEETEIH